MSGRGRSVLALASVATVVAVLTGCADGVGALRPAGAAAPSAAASRAAAPATVPTPSGAAGSAPAPESAAESGAADGTLLVTDFASDQVTFVDPRKRGAAADLGSVRVGTAPYGIALGPDGTAWVATAEGVAAVDTTAHVRTALIPYTRDTGPVTTGEYRGGGLGIAVSPDGRQVYVGVNVPGQDGELEVIDTSRRAVVAVAPVGRRPFDVDVSADGDHVYVTGHDSFDVTVVDTRDRNTRRITVAPYGTQGGLGSWQKPHYLAVRPSDGALLLPFEGGRLAVVDPATGRTTVEPMTAHTHQHGVAVGQDGTLYVVGTGPVDPANEAGPSLTIRRPDGRERVIPLPGPHENVAPTRDGRAAYVTGGYTRDGYWNGISAVDLDTGAVSRLAVGQRPLGIVVLGAVGSERSGRR